MDATPNTAAPESAQMGLTGLWRQVAQFGALGVILVCFYQDRHASQEQAKEDRVLFRETVQRQQDGMARFADQAHDDSQRQWKAIEKLTIAVRTPERDK